MPTAEKRSPADCLHCEHRGSRMFCNFSPATLEDYDTIGTILTLPKGTILFREADAGNRVYVLCIGHVKLSCISKEGKMMNLKIASAGDVLGLSAVIAGSPFEVSAEALEPTTAKVIRRADFNAFLQRQGEASLHAARALSEEYKSAFAEARRLALSGSVSGRLATLLLEWGHVAACGNREMRFTMALTHDDLASFAATTRETITRSMSKFQSDKLIEIRGTSVHILEPEKLAALSS